MLIDRLARTEQNARRLAEIVGTLAKYGLADWLAGVPHTEWFRRHLAPRSFQTISDVTHEARVRLVLTELGTTFIKFGQVLSTRPDIVTSAMADELTKLQTDTPPDPPDVVRGVIAAELGKQPEELFATFDPVPLASASIGQVHAGTTLDGRRVVIKVQHAGIQDRIARDLDLLAGLAELAERYYEPSRMFRPIATVQQFRKVLARELDFAAERHNLTAFRRNFQRDKTVRFPEPIVELCTRRVLTMDRFDGTRASEIKPGGTFDPQIIARRAARAYLKMIFRDGFYHADPHPGNYIVLPDGTLGIFDAGMVGRLDDELRDQLEGLIVAIYHRDPGDLTDQICALAESPPVDPIALRAEVSEFVDDFAHQQLKEFDLSGALTRMMDIIRRFGIALPPGVALLLRTLVVLEGSARQLHPAFSLTEVIEQHMRDQGPRQLIRRFRRKMTKAVHDWDRFMTGLPRQMDDLLRRFRDGKLDIHHEHRGIERTVNRLVRGIITAALIVASAQMWVARTPPTIGEVPVLGALGYLIAAWLGVKLIRSTRE